MTKTALARRIATALLNATRMVDADNPTVKQLVANNSKERLEDLYEQAANLWAAVHGTHIEESL